MSASDKKVKSKGKKAPYVPTEAAVKAITTCSAALEALTAQDRGHVVARLRAMYFNRSRRAGKPEPRKERKTQPQKIKWRVEFEKTEVFKNRMKWKEENRKFMDSIQDHYNNLTVEEEGRYAPYRELTEEFAALKKKMQDDFYEKSGIKKPEPSKKKVKTPVPPPDNKGSGRSVPPAVPADDPTKKGNNPILPIGSAACEKLFSGW